MSDEKGGFRKLDMDIEGRRRRFEERKAKNEAITKKLKAEMPKDCTCICPGCGNEAAWREFHIDERSLAIRSHISCKVCESAARENRFRRFQERCGIVDDFAEKSLLNFEVTNPMQQDAVDAATEFIQSSESGRWLAFFGKPGTGKGHLALAVANGVLRTLSEIGAPPRSNYVMYIKHIRLIRMIRSSYSRDDVTEEEVIAKLDAPELLIIDEVGLKDEISAWERSTLDDLFDYRYEKRKSLIITSNLSANELFDLLGQRVRSRFSERGRIIPFTWDDYRKGENA